MTTVTKESILLAWSGGKDSALALHELWRAGRWEVLALLTTVTQGYGRVSMHGVRKDLLDRQAAALGLPVCEVAIGPKAGMEQYEMRMRQALEQYIPRGVSAVAFGDILLEDLRAYRQDKLAQVGLKAIFPLWKQDTAELAGRFISAGFKAVITCVDSKVLDKSFVGRAFDHQFLGDLPPGVDCCGENGQFHSFVYDGPIFRGPVRHRIGRVVLREERFWFCDLIPTE